MIPVLCVLCGVCATLGFLAARPWLLRQLTAEERRVRDTALRFTPNPVDARRWALGLYLGRAILLALLLLAIPNPFLALVIWLAAQMGPAFLIEHFWQKRRARMDDQMPAAIWSMASSMDAGLSLVQAVQRVAQTAPQPIRHEFRILANSYALGVDLETAILETKKRLALPTFNMFASALLVNREMGGNVANTLRRIAASLERLKQMKGTIKAETADGRTNIKLLVCAPVFMLLLLATVDAQGVALVFRTFEGMLVLGGAGALAGIGVFWASKIVGQEL